MNITDFSRVDVVYDDDKGRAWTMKLRTVYVGQTGLAGGQGGQGRKPSNIVARHVWIKAVDGAHIVKRKVPCSREWVMNSYAPGVGISADGVSFECEGYVGEKERDA
jgi:hypothetical protein